MSGRTTKWLGGSRLCVALATGIVGASVLAGCGATGSAASAGQIATAASPSSDHTPSADRTRPAAIGPSTEPECTAKPVTGCEEGAPSFTGEVQPLLQRRCFRCHTGDGVAAEEHDFGRLEALRAARSEIVNEVASCGMPPRAPLASDEARTLLRWAACGANTQ